MNTYIYRHTRQEHFTTLVYLVCVCGGQGTAGSSGLFLSNVQVQRQSSGCTALGSLGSREAFCCCFLLKALLSFVVRFFYLWYEMEIKIFSGS